MSNHRFNHPRGAPSAGIGMLCVMMGGVLLFVHWQLYEYAYDDAYIHFRVAAQLLEHGVPYFNPLEPVKVSSSSGWTMVLCVLTVFSKLSGVALPMVVAMWNSVMSCCGALVYTWLFVLVVGRRAKVVAGLFALVYLAIIIRPSIGLMESPTTMLLAGCAFHLLWRGHPAALTAFGAATFFRTEMGVVWAVVTVHSLLSRRFSLRQVVAYSAPGVLPFVAYDLYFFGTVLPQAVRAKLAVYQLGRGRSATLVGLGFLPEASTPWFSFSYEQNLTAPLFLWFVLIVLVAYAIGRAITPSLRGMPAIMMLSGTAIMAFYIAPGAHVFPWYYPLYTIPVFFAIAAAVASCSFPPLAYLIAALAFPIVGLNVLSLAQIVYSTTDRAAYPDFESGARVRHYIDLGRRLAARYPGARLMTSEIGGLGYGFSGYIIDGAGLATPAALRYHPLAVPSERSDEMIGAIPVAFIGETDPELIVSYDIFIEAFLRSDAAQHYTRIKYPIFLDEDMKGSRTGMLWDSRALNLFVRSDLPTPDG